MPPRGKHGAGKGKTRGETGGGRRWKGKTGELGGAGRDRKSEENAAQKGQPGTGAGAVLGKPVREAKTRRGGEKTGSPETRRSDASPAKNAGNAGARQKAQSRGKAAGRLGGRAGRGAQETRKTRRAGEKARGRGRNEGRQRGAEDAGKTGKAHGKTERRRDAERRPPLPCGAYPARRLSGVPLIRKGPARRTRTGPGSAKKAGRKTQDVSVGDARRRTRRPVLPAKGG